MDIVELHATNLLELLLDPASHFQSIFKALTHSVFIILSMGIKQLEQARNSSLFGSMETHVIPNGIDVQIYKESNRNSARKILNIEPDSKIILFGSSSLRDGRKGISLIPEILSTLKHELPSEKIGVLFFGSQNSSILSELPFPSKYLGHLFDDYSLACAYQAADVFITPSLQDNLPNTVMEAMACSTPCVAFDKGGMPDMIDHLVNGYLAQPFDIRDFALGIKKCLAFKHHETGRKMREMARLKVLHNFELTVIARRYEELYKTILDK